MSSDEFDLEDLDFFDSGRPEDPDTLKEVVRQSVIAGIAIVIPLAVTLLILGFVVNFIDNALQPVVGVIQGAPFGPNQFAAWQLKIMAVVVMVVGIFLIGFVAKFGSRETGLGDQFDEMMASIPGIGRVYTSFDEMSEILMDSDTESFQEVKLVEYPTEDSFVVAFKTASTPEIIRTGTGNDAMETLFMPMAPNPVMGGFVIHVSADKVHDVDMSVEQGIRSIVTSGVAVGDDDVTRSLDADQLRDLGHTGRIERQVDPSGVPTVPQDAVAEPDERVEQYDSSISPEYSDTARKIVERERDTDRGDETDSVPAEMEGRNDDERDRTDVPPEELAGRDPDDRDRTEVPPEERAGGGDDAGQAGNDDTTSDDEEGGNDAASADEER